MIAILHDHFARVFNGLPLPLRAADVLPAWDFGKDHQTDAVTFVNEVAALRIVRRAHGIA